MIAAPQTGNDCICYNAQDDAPPPDDAEFVVPAGVEMPAVPNHIAIRRDTDDDGVADVAAEFGVALWLDRDSSGTVNAGDVLVFGPPTIRPLHPLAVVKWSPVQTV